MKKYLLLIFFFILSASAYASSPVLFYSDLLGGPGTGGQNNLGVFVTVWGVNLGATQGTSTITVGGGSVANTQTWTTYTRGGYTFEEVCFQLGSSASTGNIVITVNGVASNGLPFTVRSGNIYFVDVTQGVNGSGTYASPWNTLVSPFNTMVAGDTVYLRAGTVTNTKYEDYGGSMMAIGGGLTGTATSPYAWIGYPNETFSMVSTSVNYIWRNGGSGGATYVTIAKTTDRNSSGVYGSFSNAVTGWRLVGNDISDQNANYGLIDFSGTNVKILGNIIHDSVETVQNNQTHSVYIDGPNSNFEVGWNYFYNNNGQGNEISNYHNGPRTGSIHDNLIIASAGAGSIRGMLAAGCGDNGTDDFSTMYTNTTNVYNNILVNTGYSGGHNGGAIQLECGTNYIYNNTVYGAGTETHGLIQDLPGGVGPSGGSPKEYVADNIFYSNQSGLYISDGNGNAPSWSDFSSLTNNIYYGEGNGPSQDSHPINSNPLLTSPTTDTTGNWSLQATSPAISAGYNTNSIVANDYNGVTRPNPPDIGAYQYSSGGGGGGGGSSSTGDLWRNLTIKKVIFD